MFSIDKQSTIPGFLLIEQLITLVCLMVFCLTVTIALGHLARVRSRIKHQTEALSIARNEISGILHENQPEIGKKARRNFQIETISRQIPLSCKGSYELKVPLALLYTVTIQWKEDDYERQLSMCTIKEG